MLQKYKLYSVQVLPFQHILFYLHNYTQITVVLSENFILKIMLYNIKKVIIDRKFNCLKLMIVIDIKGNNKNNYHNFIFLTDLFSF